MKTTYRCKRGRATAVFAVSKARAGTIPRLGGVTAPLTAVEKGKTEHLSVSVSKIVPASPFWTSNFGLACNALGSNVGSLIAPNFSASLPTTIDVGPWLFEVVYWYTHKRYVWEYTSSLGNGATPPYCSYP